MILHQKFQQLREIISNNTSSINSIDTKNTSQDNSITSINGSINSINTSINSINTDVSIELAQGMDLILSQVQETKNK